MIFNFIMHETIAKLEGLKNNFIENIWISVF